MRERAYDAIDAASTTARVAAMPFPQDGLEFERPAADRQPIEQPHELGSSAPASTRLPRAISPAMPEKQLNQAMRHPPPPVTEHPRHRAGGTVTVVDPDHRHPGGARRVHVRNAVMPSSAAP